VDYPDLVPGRVYRLVFQREATADTVGAQGERALEENNCIYEGKAGEWWGFVGADGIQRLMVNPAHVAYIELHVAAGVSDNYGDWAAGDPDGPS
jgi:hypothetical protein